LTFENVCELLIVSDIYSAPRLRHRAVEFIIQHPRNITSTPGWDNVVKQHHDLVTDIVRHFDKSSDREDIFGELVPQYASHTS
uniref:Rhamnosyl O-methyltransferase n=1 Tax=Brugia timori TaxID=42155 RepID=A0A0R3QYW0_9BILA